MTTITFESSKYLSIHYLSNYYDKPEPVTLRKHEIIEAFLSICGRGKNQAKKPFIYNYNLGKDDSWYNPICDPSTLVYVCEKLVLKLSQD